MTGCAIVPFHVWERNEPLGGWTCIPPEPGGRRSADRCPGCGEFVGDLDMNTLEHRLGERAPGGNLFVHLAYALRVADNGRSGADG